MQRMKGTYIMELQLLQNHGLPMDAKLLTLSNRQKRKKTTTLGAIVTQGFLFGSKFFWHGSIWKDV